MVSDLGRGIAVHVARDHDYTGFPVRVAAARTVDGGGTGHVRKSIANEIAQLLRILAGQIILSFMELDRSTEQLKVALDIELVIGITL
jgi:hypothetical protein